MTHKKCVSGCSKQCGLGSAFYAKNDSIAYWRNTSAQILTNRRVPLSSRGRWPFVEVHAEFGLLGGNEKLQQAIYHNTVLGCFLVHGLQKVGAVDTVYQFDVIDNVLYLVGLQMANEVPFDIGRKVGMLLLHFLRVVLAKNAMSGIVGFHNVGFGLGFRYRNKPHTCRQRRFYTV